MLKKIFYLLDKKQKHNFLVLIFLVFIGMLFEMLSLGLIFPAFTFLLKNNIQNDNKYFNALINALGNPGHKILAIYGMSFLVLIYLFKTFYLIFLSWIQSGFIANFVADLSNKLFFEYLNTTYPFHLKNNSSHLLRNIQNEIELINTQLQQIIQIITESSIVIGITILLFSIEPKGAISTSFIFVTTSIFFYRIFKKKLKNWGVIRQESYGFKNQYLLEGLNGVKDVKILGREKYFFNQFSNYNLSFAKITRKVNTLGQIPRLYLELIGIAGLVGLLISLVLQDKSIDLFIPTLGIFIASAFRVMPSVNRIMSAFQTIKYTQPALDLIYNEVSTLSKIKGEEQNSKTSKLIFNTKIELLNIHFMYENIKNVTLSNISLIINKGDMVGFIGESGSGKSTLIDILLGLQIPNNGKVEVDGLDIRYHAREWQNQIGYVSQSIYLIDNTIRNNIAFGIPENEINESAMKQAITDSQLEEFLNELPLGQFTNVGERGVRLSGGQRQRIGIARALYHNPDVLLLDEATSSLDNETEKNIIDSINQLKRKKTIIIVAHRLTTIKNCDKIFCFKKGKLINEGTPNKIIQN